MLTLNLWLRCFLFLCVKVTSSALHVPCDNVLIVKVLQRSNTNYSQFPKFSIWCFSIERTFNLNSFTLFRTHGVRQRFKTENFSNLNWIQHMVYKIYGLNLITFSGLTLRNWFDLTLIFRYTSCRGALTLTVALQIHYFDWFHEKLYFRYCENLQKKYVSYHQL